jgi:hypothetical protein
MEDTTSRLVKTSVIFKMLAAKVLPEDRLYGAFCELAEVFPNIGKQSFLRMKNRGQIATIPGTAGKYCFASVLWDMIFYEVYEDENIFWEDPETEKQKRIREITEDADLRFAEAVKRKGLVETLS